MLLGLWQKERTVRRFSPQTTDGGFGYTAHSDIKVMADVQTPDRKQSTDTDGDSTVQHLKVFSNEKFLTADENSGQRADLLWYQEKWFECRASRLSENTMLAHWTSEFVQLADQPAAPGEEEDG